MGARIKWLQPQHFDLLVDADSPQIFQGTPLKAVPAGHLGWAAVAFFSHRADGAS